MYRFRFLSLFSTAMMLASLVTSASADQILDWNATIRTIMQTNTSKANPGWSTRAMAISNGAMYDVTAAFGNTGAGYLYKGAAPSTGNQTDAKSAAIAQAAYNGMVYSYQNEPDFAATLKPILDAQLAAQLGGITNSQAKTDGIAFGNAVSTAYTNWRANDGASAQVQYIPNPALGHWQPDPTRPTPQVVWGPEWGKVNTYTMPSSTYVPVNGPPAMGSQAYADAYNEVKELGKVWADNSLRNATQMEELKIATFWGYDRPGMGPPPVLYSKNVHEIATQKGNTQDQNAKLFAMVSVALADASIAGWDYKFINDFWRPITAIRAGDLDGNPMTVGDPNWVPVGAPGPNPAISTDDFTPPFPAYPSGHATFGGATFQILREFYGSDSFNYTLTSAEAMPNDTGILSGPNNQMVRSFSNFTDAEWENAISRIYLGVHWRFEAVDGVALGQDIGQYVFANFQAVPEPSTFVLGALVLGGIGYAARRRKKMAA